MAETRKGHTVTLPPEASLVAIALEAGAVLASCVPVSAFEFDEYFRRLCEQNRCGHYGKNLMCPPLLGEYGDLVEKVRTYPLVLVFQTVHPLKSSLDITGMHKGGIAHEKVIRTLRALVSERFSLHSLLPLSAGPCRYCAECAGMRAEPCAHPDQALASIEAHGVDVGKLLARSALPASHGKNTVSYTGCLLMGKNIP